MHAEIIDFLNKAKFDSGLGEQRLSVIEFGSYIINDSARDVFSKSSSCYTGVDWRAGEGVDVVCFAHEYERPESVPHHEVGVCCQVLEHDPYWQKTVTKLFDCVTEIPGKTAWLFITCAGPGYPVHELETAPLVNGEPYYCNVSTDEIEGVLLSHASLKKRSVTLHKEYKRGTLDSLVWARIE